jgi:hypothetical protein
MSCLSVQGKYLPQESTITNSYFNTRFSPCSFDPPITSLCQFHIVDGGYIKALLRRVYLCQLQHIIQELELETS